MHTMPLFHVVSQNVAISSLPAGLWYRVVSCLAKSLEIPFSKSFYGVTERGGQLSARLRGLRPHDVPGERLYTKISNFATMALLAFILDILFAEVFQADYDANLKQKIGRALIVEKDRSSTVASMSEW